MEKARFFKKLEDKKVQCTVCYRNCVIAPNSTGFCRVRKNIDGELYLITYGKVCACALDPIEKKPFYHFYPGSKAFSLSCVGCNFACSFCCNWEISHEWSELGEELSPSRIVELAEKMGADGLSYTYTEPSVWIEFALDIAKLAKKKDLYNTMVTNGYTQPEVIREIAKYIDAVVVDLKNSGSEEAYKKLSSISNAGKIFESILEYKKRGVWLEITNLIVTRYGERKEDVQKFCKWVIENLGDEIPVHFLKYFPSYKLTLPPTNTEFLLKCVEIAKKEGLKYVYLGNTPFTQYENTYCPGCGKLLIEREGVFLKRIHITEPYCPDCGKKIPVVL